jgi:sterol 3beta-glucosyltransferase
MASHANLRESLGRKALKRKAGSSKLSMDLPERLKDADDTAEDVTAAPKDSPARYMNQSIFSMITAAGSTTNFQSRFDEDSSDSDGHDNDEPQSTPSVLPTTVALQAPYDGPSERPARATSRHKLLSKLKLKPIRERRSASETADDMMNSSQILTPRTLEDMERRALSGDAPVLSRRVQAEADMDVSEEEEAPRSRILLSPKKQPPTLAQKLKDIFHFDEPEEVILEARCWLLQSVLLMGFMYMTQKHVCFYAYLPKKAATVEKSGYLSKQGKRTTRHRRFYFELKGDVLSYYVSPTDKYYPHGSIDLRNAISATLSEPKDKSKGSADFTLATEGRTYYFKADRSASAKEWVKNLQRAIFRSHNDGDAVKISLPIENIMDIEENPILDCAETVKIRVIDNDETYAIDEVSSSFVDSAQTTGLLTMP